MQIVAVIHQTNMRYLLGGWKQRRPAGAAKAAAAEQQAEYANYDRLETYLGRPAWSVCGSYSR
jgi:hypothetical protein